MVIKDSQNMEGISADQLEEQLQYTCRNVISTLMENPGNTNCEGIWSECTSKCEKAGERVWKQIVPPKGLGLPCPKTSDCKVGDGGCIPTNTISSSFVLSDAGVIDSKKEKQHIWGPIFEGGHILKRSHF